MSTIWDITLREWLTFICNGFIDNAGNFCKVKERAMSIHCPEQTILTDPHLIRDCLEELKGLKVTGDAHLVSKYGPYRIYTALSVLKSLNRYNCPIPSKTKEFFQLHADLYKNGAFDSEKLAEAKSINHMYIVEVDVSESTDTDSTLSDAKLRFLIDGVNRLTLVQERLTHIYGRFERETIE
ncbi:hypothetical protein [Vibrio paucivorans]